LHFGKCDFSLKEFPVILFPDVLIYNVVLQIFVLGKIPGKKNFTQCYHQNFKPVVGK
jgi:hypothetical protein